ncbi:MAG: hypothetical protein JWQ27_2775 [Ferruginibacter sp.]|nr:hypothetical protein [Ferruginibacter sp.]
MPGECTRYLYLYRLVFFVTTPDRVSPQEGCFGSARKGGNFLLTITYI